MTQEENSMIWSQFAPIYLTFASIWLLILLMTSILIIQLRKLPEIQHRSVWMALLSNVVCATMVLHFTLDLSTLVGYPCAFVLWLPSIIYPLWVNIAWCRGVKLIELYHSNKAALDTAAYDNVGCSTFPNNRSHVSLKQSMPLVTDAGSNGWQTRFVMRYHYLFTDRALFITILIILVVCTLSTLLVYIHTDIYTMASSINCDGRWELLPMYTILGIGILMIIVTLLPLLKGVDDAYGLRTELVILLSIGIGAFLISISLDILPSELMPNWFNAVRAGLISMLAMCIIQFLTVILPVIRTWWWWRKRDNEAEHRRTATMSTVYLDTLCGDSVWMANLRQFSVKEFSAGNVLFLERYARFHNRFLCDQKTAICDFAAILTELEIIYDNFFSSRANVRIDISEETRHELDRQFMTRQLDTSVFERAYQEVWHAVALRTIPRYQQHISATNDIALSRLRGACDLIECNCADNVSTGHCHN